MRTLQPDVLAEKNLLIKYVIALNLLIVIAILLYPAHMDEQYRYNYIIDVFCLLCVVVLYFRYVYRNGFDLFDPLLFVTIIYGSMYFATPLYDILTDNHAWFGYHMFSAGINASLIALIGYASFYLCYSVSARNYEKPAHTSVGAEQNKPAETAYNDALIPAAILAAFFAAFAANVYYLLHSGYGNLLYILTAGLLGSGTSGSEELGNIGFMAMFSYCLPTLVMLYWEYGKRKILMVVMFLLMAALQVTRGFRFLLVQIAVSFLAYYYISHKKKLRLRKLLLWMVILLAFVLFMTAFRDAVRSGAGVSLADFGGQSILKLLEDAIIDNFRIYNNYYGIVSTVPKKFDFVYGQQILLGTIIMVVPRILWPGKPSSAAGVGLERIVGIRLKGTGQAYPNLGEYYYSCGILGVILFMGIYGLWLKRIRIKYRQNGTEGIDTITFAVILASNLQLLIRGYTPSNFWLLVFSLLPIWMVKIIRSKKERMLQG